MSDDDPGRIAATDAWFLAHGLPYFVPEQREGAKSALRLGRTLAQGDREQAAGAQQAEQLAHGPGALGREHVLPHPAEQDQVEREAEPVRGGQGGKPVGDPVHARAGVAVLALRAQGGRGLDGDDVVAEPGQPGGVAPAAGTHVQHQRGGRG